MVSWLRSMSLHWDETESKFGLAEAAVVQTRMRAIIDAESPLDAWEEWLLSVEDAPGVLLVATATNPVHGPSPNPEEGRQGGKGGEPEADYRVSILHHLKPGEGQENFLGFGSLNPADNRLVSIDWEDMLNGLVISDRPERTRQTTSERNSRLVPTMMGLITGDHPVGEPFVAEEGQGEGPSLGSLSDWPRAVFVPIPVLELMMSRDEESNYPAMANGHSVDPATLIHRLLRRLRRLDADAIDRLEAVVSEVLIFLWAVTNRLNEGTVLETAEASRYTLRHVADCVDELIGPPNFRGKHPDLNQRARDGPEDEDEEGNYPKEVGSKAGQGNRGETTEITQADSRGLDPSVPRPNERAPLPPFPTGAHPPLPRKMGCPRLGSGRS